MAKRKDSDSGMALKADDAAAFRAATRDVKPLQHTPRVEHVRAKPRARRRPPQQDTMDVDAAMPLVHSAEQAIAGAVLSYQRAGVRTQVMRKLRRGLYPSDAEIDLHGLTQAPARDQLAAFISASRDAGYRCVRIVHGKGYRSGARGPVLKTAVDSWLRRHFDVMAFVSAKAIDGGTGAVYVLLRA